LTRWLTIGLLVVAGLAVGVYLYSRFVVATVTVTEVVEGPVVEAFYATGTLQPDREYPIRSNVEGTLTELLVDKGSIVHAQDKLAFVRVEEFQMRFSQALANLVLAQRLVNDSESPALREFDDRLRAANEQLNLAQNELDRLLHLQASQAAMQIEIDRARDRVQTLWSAAESIKSQRAARKLELERDMTVAQAALDIAQWNIDQQTIRAPADGVVLDRPVSLGTRVKINDQLMRIADVSPENLVMRAAVDEEDKTRLQPEQLVNLTLYAYPARVFQGVVKRIYPQADPERRTFEVDVQVTPPDQRFAAGMTGELAFVVASRSSAIIVPSQVVQRDALWIVRDNRLERINVEIGLRSIERTEILRGVQPGDRVVISPSTEFKEGSIVKTHYLDPAIAAGLNTPAAQTPMRGFNGGM
jgi:multidrug efflux pump subunit AcrA (membrane-fusion protein)